MATFKRKKHASVGNTATFIENYTAPTAGAVIIGMSIANKLSGQAINVDVTLTVGATPGSPPTGGTDYYIVKNAPIPIGGSLVVVGGDQKIVMESGDAVTVKTDYAGSAADVILSILEN